MKQTFVVDTEENVLEFDRLLRSIISLIFPDWKEYIMELAYEISADEYIRCLECEERIYYLDKFCRHCGHEVNKNKEV